ncbi:MAG: 3-hydroxyacyl-CoA dehydrogenase family protein [Sedimentibacter sp.]
MKYPEIKRICCYGVGLIGTGCATNYIMKGYPVNMYNSKQTSLEKARGRIEGNCARLVEAGVLTDEQAEKALKLVTYTTSLEEALSDVQLIQESAPDKYEVKKDVIETVDKYCGNDVIIATSSSALLISQISAYSKFPERVICAHPYNPVHLIPLIELVGAEGSEDAVQHAKEFFALIGKEPVVLKKEIKGYIANRLQVVVGREIVELLERGVCTVEDADKALTFGPGIRWAIMGHMLAMQLGFAGGVKAMYDKIIVKGSDRSSYLDDMANWIKYPEDLPELSQAGVDEEMANRSPEIGNTNESLIEYRDKMLIEILKLHKKL